MKFLFYLHILFFFCSNHPLMNLNKPDNRDLSTPQLNPKFYIGLYCCTVIYSLIFVWLLENHLPNLHAGMGLMKGDNIMFHNLAVEMTKNIASKGWGEWKIFSLGLAGTLNVALTSVVYYFLGIHPQIIILTNALLQIFSAFILGKIIFRYTQKPIYSYIVAVLFCFFPVTLIWVSQLHKDNYALLAWMLIFYSVINNQENSKPYQTIIASTVGLFLLVLIRPLYLKLVCAFFALDVLLTLLKNRKQLIPSILNLAVASLFLMSFYRFAPIDVKNTRDDYYDASEHVIGHQVSSPAGSKDYTFVWHGNKTGLDKIFLQMASMRVFQIFLFDHESNSFIDRDVIFTTSFDFVKYAPRAAEISLLEPNPLFLFKLKSLTSLSAILEMVIYYFFFLCFLIALCLKKIEFTLLKIVLYSFICSTTLAYITPVMGAFHRTRYPFFFIIITVGLIALHRLVESYPRPQNNDSKI